jgi:hypothetical protein
MGGPWAGYRVLPYAGQQGKAAHDYADENRCFIWVGLGNVECIKKPVRGSAG